VETPTDLAQWRKDQRLMLLARRLAAAPAESAEWNHAIKANLEQGFPSLCRMVVGYCWPYKGEFDARSLIRKLRSQGARVALPAVVAKGQPLQFREWWPGAAMKPGVLGLPVPDGTPVLVPDAALIPCVGFSEEGGRLGYGGGYFDRTLAALSPQPLKIGVAFEGSRMPTIYPQSYDIIMDFIVTEVGIHAVEKSGMRLVDAAECARREALIVAERGLPLVQSNVRQAT
jgi:5,10-methenyltetrahydrofolate synthetase